MNRGFIAATLVLVASGLLSLVVRGQTSDDNATLGLIDAFKNYPSLTPDSASNLVHQIIPGIAASDQPEMLKQELLTVLDNRRLSAVVKASSNADGRILQLMHVTDRSLPDDLTDDKLASTVKKGGKSLQSKIRRIWFNRAVNVAFINSLTNYPPDEAARIARAVSRPWFSIRRKPNGVSDTTAASISLQGVYADSGINYLTERSTAMKLLDWMGVIDVPLSTRADFESSQQPSVIMQLPQPWWTSDDEPILQSLVNDPVYGNAATQVLQSVFGS
jgi:hypothetical protein